MWNNEFPTNANNSSSTMNTTGVESQTVSVSSPRRSRKDLPPLFWYMESGDWEKATDRVRRHPKEVKTWATLKTKTLDTDGSASSAIGNGLQQESAGGSNNDFNFDASGSNVTNTVVNTKPVTTSTKRLALHHACFKLRAAGALAPPIHSAVTRKPAVDPFVEVCRFILLLIRLYPDAAARRESRHGCLPIHLAAFASCIPRTNESNDPNGSAASVIAPASSRDSQTSAREGNSFDASDAFNNRFATKMTVGNAITKPKNVRRAESDGTTDTIQTNMSAVQAEENYTGDMSETQQAKPNALLQGSNNLASTNAQRVSVSMRNNLVISAKREEMLVQVINALLDAYPKAARVDSEGGRLPLHTACAGRATPRVVSTLITAYPAACRQRNKDGFLPLHLAAHWGVSHPAVAVQLLRAYPDATVGRNRWERTPLEEALCMAGENGRPHQAALVRALRKHPSYWTRPTSEFGFVQMPRAASAAQRPPSTVVDIDESLPSNDSTDDTNDEALQMTRYYNQARHLMDEGIIDEEEEEEYEAEEELVLATNSDMRGSVQVHDAAESLQKDYSPTTLRQRLSPRGMRNINKKRDMYSNDDVSNMSLCTLIEKRIWKIAVARIMADPLSAERDLKVMTRGGFMASTGMSPLHYACERRPPVPLVRVLIDAFPFAVLTRAMPGGCLPLHIACTWGASPEIVEALLSADHGSVKVKDELGNVALHSACFSGADIRIIAMLLAADAKSIIARNHQGSRPIDICKRLRHDNRRDVMNLLNRRKEEIMRAHHRSRSSGLLVDIAKEAEEKNSRDGPPVGTHNNANKDDDFVFHEQQAVEVTYDENDKNHELLWV